MIDQLVALALPVDKIHHNRQISMHSAEFDPAIPAIKLSQTYALDRTTTDIGRGSLRHN
jgi:hypothetical protein